MNILYLIGIAVGLSMDALAVSVTNGNSIKNLKVHNAITIAFSFGMFQAVMPVLGWFGGTSLLFLIKTIDHWIAFLILAVIGGKMILESTVLSEKDGECKNCLHFPTLMALSVATSIDAFAVGISIGALKIPIVIPAIIIGSITFLICFAGVFIGKLIGHFFEKKLEIIGGIILILIGVKILAEHLFNF